MSERLLIGLLVFEKFLWVSTHSFLSIFDTEAGYYTVRLDTGTFGSGIYSIQFDAGNYREIKKIVLVR